MSVEHHDFEAELRRLRERSREVQLWAARAQLAIMIAFGIGVVIAAPVMVKNIILGVAAALPGAGQ